VLWGERKLDGHRLTLVKDKGVCSAWGKKGINIWRDVPPQIRQLFEGVPDGTVFDGECVPIDETGTASDVSHLWAEQKDKLKFDVFAVPFWDGERYFKANESISTILLDKAEEYGFPTAIAYKPEDCTREQAAKAGWEGFVLKANNYRDWYKIKVYHTLDVIVMGAVAGVDGKFASRWGTLICAVWKDGERKVVAHVAKGCDSEWRDLPIGELVGRVCEISHEGVQAQGKLRFSAFMRWRDDKDEKVCTYDQLKEVK
jgi:ATP-dependent DNA ligase